MPTIKQSAIINRTIVVRLIIVRCFIATVVVGDVFDVISAGFEFSNVNDIFFITKSDHKLRHSYFIILVQD